MKAAYVTSIVLLSTLTAFGVSLWSETRASNWQAESESRESRAQSADEAPISDLHATLADAMRFSDANGRPILIYVRPSPAARIELEREMRGSDRLRSRFEAFETYCVDVWDSDVDHLRDSFEALDTFGVATAPHFLVVEARSAAPTDLRVRAAARPIIGLTFDANGLAHELARLAGDAGSAPHVSPDLGGDVDANATPGDAAAREALSRAREHQAAGRFQDAAVTFANALASERSEIGPLHRTALFESALTSIAGDRPFEKRLQEVLVNEADRSVLFRGHGVRARSFARRAALASGQEQKQLRRDLRTAARLVYQNTADEDLVPVMETIVQWFALDPADIDTMDRIFVRGLGAKIASADPGSPALAAVEAALKRP